MACHLFGDKPLSEPMMIQFTAEYEMEFPHFMISLIKSLGPSSESVVMEHVIQCYAGIVILANKELSSRFRC